MDSWHRNFVAREGEAVEDSGRAYEERVKKQAFENKNGYCQKRFEEKIKDQMSGMPMPDHMHGRY